MNQDLNRIRPGNIIKVAWRDACEGPIEERALERGIRFQGSPSVTLTTIGRYLKVSKGYLIVDDVLHEESEGSILFEKQAKGKWLSIPLGVILQITPFGEIMPSTSREMKRRRTILKQLRFIPRAVRLPSGEISRTLYMV